MHPRFFDAVRHLHPTVNFTCDVVVQDDGKGPFLATWNLPGAPPSDAEIDALAPALDAPPVPPSVEAAAAKMALSRAGLLAQFKIAVAAYPEEVQIWFSDATVWRRTDPYVMGIGLELGLTDEAMDDLFRAAARLS